MKNIVNNNSYKRNFIKFLRIALAVILFALIVASVYIGRRQFGGNLSEGDISLSELYAPFDFAIQGELDETSTNEEIKKAKEAVLDVYDYNSGKFESKVAQLEDFFAQLKVFRDSSEQSQEKKEKLGKQFGFSQKLVNSLLRSENLDILKDNSKQLAKEILNQPIISAEDKSKLLSLNKDKLLLRELSGEGVVEKEIQGIAEPDALSREVELFADKAFPDKRRIRVNLAGLLKSLIEPNLVFNPELTSKYKDEAAKNVAPVYQEIGVKKDELLVAKGQRVTKENIEMLREINRRSNKINALLFILGAGIIILILFIIVTIYLRSFEPKVYADLESLLLVGILTLLIVVATRLISLSSIPTYLIPIASMVMLITMLIGPTTALKMNLVMSILVSILLGSNLERMVVFLIGGVVGVFLVEKARRRSQVLKAGFGVGVTQLVCIVGFGLLNNLGYHSFLREGMWGLLNGIICSFITLGSLPVFEYVFRLVSNITLLELSDLNSPLLKEMIIKAPGTYHHSLIVGNLAETAAEAIGANSLLARVGSYYHDIGKIEKAEYFSENQLSPRSKHSKLTPALSSLIIINHIKEGIELAKRHKLNRRIIDIIGQHHGTGKVQFFYQRALIKGEDEKDIENRFCYPGPRPQSSEGAIVLLADSVEAASRTLTDSSPASIRNLVKRIVNNKFVEGQLDDCNLTLKDINKINECFVNILTGIFHTRIKYPETSVEPNGKDRDNQPEKEVPFSFKGDKGEGKDNS